MINMALITFFYYLLLFFITVPNKKHGLPWWFSGKESVCKWRHGFDP